MGTCGSRSGRQKDKRLRQAGNTRQHGWGMHACIGMTIHWMGRKSSSRQNQERKTRWVDRSMKGQQESLKPGECRRLTRKGTLGGQTDSQDGHEDLVGHGIDDAANHRLQLPAPGDPAIEEVRNTGVDKQAESPRMCIVENSVADERGGNQATGGEKIRYCVNVFMRRQGWDGKHLSETARSRLRVDGRRCSRPVASGLAEETLQNLDLTFCHA